MSRKSNAEKENELLIEQLKNANAEIHALKLERHLQFCDRIDERYKVRKAHHIIGELFSAIAVERMKKELVLLDDDFEVTVTLESKESLSDEDNAKTDQH